jgi:hypothetical protein
MNTEPLPDFPAPYPSLDASKFLPNYMYNKVMMEAKDGTIATEPFILWMGLGL